MARKIKVRKSHEKEGFNKPVFEYRPDWPYVSVGFGDERDFFIENLSLLLSSGMGISASLSSMRMSVKSRKMKKIVGVIEEMVDVGLPLWKSFQTTNLFPERIIALIRSGEESGKLADHLNLVTLQKSKEKIFISRLRSALLYPGIVLFLAFVLALSSSWLILPRFVSIFEDMGAELPIATQILMSIGTFFQSHGYWAVPLFVFIFSLCIYLLFFQKKTKFVGDSILLSTPGIKNLIQGVELARFGYISGTMLQAGMQIGEVFDMAKKGTNYSCYRKFYEYLQEKVLQGDSFRSAILNYPHVDRLMPIPIQQLIISAEKSGKLPETFIRIGTIFEEKTEAMARDLSVVLEPIILIIIGVLVAFLVIAIIGPIYGLSGQF